jgi:hypothetical protein
MLMKSGSVSPANATEALPMEATIRVEISAFLNIMVSLRFKN